MREWKRDTLLSLSLSLSFDSTEQFSQYSKWCVWKMRSRGGRVFIQIQRDFGVTDALLYQSSFSIDKGDAFGIKGRSSHIHFENKRHLRFWSSQCQMKSKSIISCYVDQGCSSRAILCDTHEITMKWTVHFKILIEFTLVSCFCYSFESNRKSLASSMRIKTFLAPPIML